MAKTEAEIATKKEKKEKKRKLEEVSDAEPTPKKSKKDKKSRKSEVAEDAMEIDGTEVVKVEPGKSEDKKDEKAIIAIPVAALVPFANPLAEEKDQKKVLKGVKKAAKFHTLKRGVKEVVKSLRKSPAATPATLSSSALPLGIVILAADISPPDVISHIPVLCEDHGIPYLYVLSRAELGAAGSTKRPTSVVMITKEAAGARGKKGEEATDGEWEETFKDVVKVARRLGEGVKV